MKCLLRSHGTHQIRSWKHWSKQKGGFYCGTRVWAGWFTKSIQGGSLAITMFVVNMRQAMATDRTTQKNEGDWGKSRSMMACIFLNKWCFHKPWCWHESWNLQATAVAALTSLCKIRDALLCLVKRSLHRTSMHKHRVKRSNHCWPVPGSKLVPGPVHGSVVLWTRCQVTEPGGREKEEQSGSKWCPSFQGID
jgi:hypothetical protein